MPRACNRSYGNKIHNPLGIQYECVIFHDSQSMPLHARFELGGRCILCTSQFRYKSRVYKQPNVDEKQIAKLHTKVRTNVFLCAFHVLLYNCLTCTTELFEMT